MTPLHTYILEPTHARQRGFSLLEVLIALLVLSIGLLGLAGLQTFSVKFVHQSYQRTQATMLITEMMDRMRANGAGVGVAAGNYALPANSTSWAAGADCATAFCTPAQMVNYDMNQWLSNITTKVALAQGTGSILTAAAGVGAPLLSTITVTWKEHDIVFTQSVTAQLP